MVKDDHVYSSGFIEIDLYDWIANSFMVYLNVAC